VINAELARQLEIVALEYNDIADSIERGVGDQAQEKS
jgi:hypothetical protein